MKELVVEPTACRESKDLTTTPCYRRCIDVGFYAQTEEGTEKQNTSGGRSGDRRSKGGQLFWSGRQDSNLRPLHPQRSALPNCATPRRFHKYTLRVRKVLTLRQWASYRGAVMTKVRPPDSKYRNAARPSGTSRPPRLGLSRDPAFRLAFWLSAISRDFWELSAVLEASL